jgi:phosphoheptose isomerase
MKYISRLVQKYPELSSIQPQIEQAYEILVESFSRGGKLLVCGNGGSAADAEHIVGELMKGYRLKRSLGERECQLLFESNPKEAEYLSRHLQSSLPAISLVSQVSLTSAIANDTAADMVFAQQVYGYGMNGDTLIGISTSGSAQNVQRAVQVAHMKGVHTIALTGRDGGQLAPQCECAVIVPCQETADIQERHESIYHTLCAMLEEEFFLA